LTSFKINSDPIKVMIWVIIGINVLSIIVIIHNKKPVHRKNFLVFFYTTSAFAIFNLLLYIYESTGQIFLSSNVANTLLSLGIGLSVLSIAFWLIERQVGNHEGR
jgi:multisubunit Na+/H+ antiporter MnhB subunit